jgi:hypothetical protein
MVLYGIQFDDEDNYFVELTKGTSKIVLKIKCAQTHTKRPGPNTPRLIEVSLL